MLNELVRQQATNSKLRRQVNETKNSWFLSTEQSSWLQLSWKHKRAGKFNYLIDQGLSSLLEDQIPDEMHNPPHTLESNCVRQQLQQQKWPGLEIAVPIILDGPNDPQSTGKWLRPTNRNGTTNGDPVPLIATPFNQRGNVAYAKPEKPAPCSRSSPVTQRTADFASAPDSNG